MSNHRKFRLSHLMPNSWFYKITEMKRPRPPSQSTAAATRSSKRPSNHYCHRATTPKPLPLSQHQSYYTDLQEKEVFPEKLHLSPLHLNPKATDIQFPKDHHHQSPTSRSTAASIEDDKFHGLQLRPIRTRPASTGARSVHRTTITRSVACPSSPRLRSRKLHDQSSSCRVSTGHQRSSAARSFAVLIASSNPSRDFRESMVEMIVENDLRAPNDLEGLLECYLSLNSREYHRVIKEVFEAIWLQIADDSIEV